MRISELSQRFRVRIVHGRPRRVKVLAYYLLYWFPALFLKMSKEKNKLNKNAEQLLNLIQFSICQMKMKIVDASLC